MPLKLFTYAMIGVFAVGLVLTVVGTLSVISGS